ncbi:uncharacterized protein LOC135463402 [Liolophura sinensis]|uniref:uncharacterized protein LOC135463402 n=1 Tax=Liolophura sinensis TaxID=3198878 RepID=UPI003158B9B4
MAVALQVLVLAIAIFCASGQREPFNGTNPLFPETSTFSYNVVLNFRSATEKIGPVCNRYITVPGSQTQLDVRTRSRVFAREARVPPQVTIQGSASTQLFTLILASQPEEEMQYATPTRPFVHYIQTDVQIGRQGALTLTSFVPFLPVTSEDQIVLVMLYTQAGPMPLDTSISRFVDNECDLGAGRCSFRIEDFVANKSLTLAFAGYFLVATDQYSTAAATALPFFENGCFWLDKFDLKANVLIGDKADQLKLGVMAKFITPGEMLDPVCGRVFHYKEDKVEITAGTGKPVPARKTRTIPWVWYHTMDGDESWKEDWFTLAYVSQVTDWPAGGSPEKPMLLWLVTNIHGGDVSNGMCDVPYLPAMPSQGEQEEAFLLFKQKKKVEINLRIIPSPIVSYSSGAPST